MIILAPEYLISVFSSDTALSADAVPALKLYFAAFIFMDLQVYRSDCFQIFKQTETGDFLLPASQGIYRRTTDLSSAIRFSHGNRWCISRRTCIKCDRRQSVLYYDVTHDIAGAEPDGKSVKYAFSSATIIS